MSDIMGTISFRDVTEGIEYVDAPCLPLILKAAILYMKCV